MEGEILGCRGAVAPLDLSPLPSEQLPLGQWSPPSFGDV